MNIRRLRSFIALAEELSFRKAAVRVNVTQPALSEQIRELERETGIMLVSRSRNHVELTLAGQKFLPAAKACLAELDQGLETLHRLRQQATKTLRLGYVEYICRPFLGATLRWFRQQMPQIEIEPIELYSSAVIEALVGHRIDLGFAFLPVGRSELASRLVFESRWMVAFPEEHPFAALKEIPAAKLRGAQLILFARHLNPPLHDHLLARLRQATDEEPRVVYHTAQPQLGYNMVEERLGLFMVSSFTQDQRSGIALRPLTGFDTRLPLGAVWNRNHETPAVRAFLKALKSAQSEGILAKQSRRLAPIR